MISGAVNHEDFNGNKGSLGPGELQLMTAGRGMVHCEVPATDGGEAFQLWINLESGKKMMPPSYRDIRKKDVNVVKKNGVRITECMTEKVKSENTDISSIVSPRMQYFADECSHANANCFS